jgi:hypothetical protein
MLASTVLTAKKFTPFDKNRTTEMAVHAERLQKFEGLIKGRYPFNGHIYFPKTPPKQLVSQVENPLKFTLMRSI